MINPKSKLKIRLIELCITIVMILHDCCQCHDMLHISHGHHWYKAIFFLFSVTFLAIS